MIFKVGSEANYRVAGISDTHDEVTYDTRGQSGGDGRRVWDLSADFPGDTKEILKVQDPDGKWYDSEFDDEAYYATRLSQDPDEPNLGVFEVTPDALRLLGVASPSEQGETALKYEPPVKILDFPLKKGKSWSTDADVSGEYNGNPLANVQVTYSSQVDATGVLKTPFAPNEGFEVLRVATEVERSTGFGFYPLGTVQTHAFVTPCFGTIATIRSTENEDSPEFDEADEIRRLAR